MSDAPVRDRLQRALDDGDVATVLKIGRNCRMAAEKGIVCECPDPEHITPGGGKGDLMCGICGLRDEAAYARYEAEFHDHVFVESDDETMRYMGRCGYCTFPPDHANHRGGQA